MIDDNVFVFVGIREQRTEAEHFGHVSGSFESVDKNPAQLSEATKHHVKVLMSAGSAIIMGSRMYGGNSMSAPINPNGRGDTATYEGE